jgi:homoserine kinase
MKYKIVFEVLEVSTDAPRQVLPKSQLMLAIPLDVELSASMVAAAIKAAVMQDSQAAPTVA